MWNSALKKAFSARTNKAVAYALLLSVGITAPALAQGSISMQGFGYPQGGNSTRVAGTAGALAEFDLLTPRNPAALTGLARAALAAQAEPEYRTLTFNEITERVNIQRIPLLMVGVRLSSRAVLSASSASFLDRNYSTTSTGEAVVNGQTVPTQDLADMRGSISDLRAGLGYRINSKLSVGLAGHVFTGSNRLDLSRRFSDSTITGSVRDTSSIDFFGRAVSVGAQLDLPRGLSAAASYRIGGRIEAENRDTVLSRATIPDRLSAGLAYSGIAGAMFAVSVDHNTWSNLQSLGSALLQTHDATNWSAGAEFATGRLRGAPVLLRAGTGHNTLPFGVIGGTVTEQRYGAGASLAITNVGRDQAVVDFSVQRANRKLSGSTAREGAWLLGIGLQIRP